VRVAIVDGDGRARLRPVTLGTDYGQRVGIASGLTGDERVIASPPDSIVDGQPVRVVGPDAGAPHASGGAGGG
jgi:multidrug efflux pump subunit AcrA (membrane-fusion protein)